MTTLKDLSRHLGLSVTQVSRALNNHSDVSEATKVRVAEAAKALDYQPNIAARRLVTGRSGIVGLIYPETPDPADALAFSQFITGLSTTFSRLGRQFMLHISEGEDGGLAVYERLVRSRSIDGFVVNIPEVEDARVKFLRAQKIPFVLHGQTMDEPDYPFYDIDNVAVGYDLTRHLIECGHRHIAIINGPHGASYVERRFIGYRRALKERGLELYPDFEIGGTMNEQLGLLETIRLFQSGGPKPTAIVAGNMRIAKGIFSALGAMSLSVPDDVSVVAHDDVLPDVPASDLPVPLTVTLAPLINSWEPLARFLSMSLDGADLAETQEIAQHEFVDGASVRVQM